MDVNSFTTRPPALQLLSDYDPNFKFKKSPPPALDPRVFEALVNTASSLS
jgi:hypothetical protein